MSWLDKLQSRWGLKSLTQVIVVLIVFACTGFSVLFLKRPVIAFFTLDGETNIWFTIIYYILILPIYNIILLFYGFIFGQFSFFWAFEKRIWYRMTGRKHNAE
ncbi:MAG: DUF6787 family protein [Cyclobacteriaceae bacterium]